MPILYDYIFYVGMTEYQIRKRHKTNPIIKTKTVAVDEEHILEIRLSIATLTCLIINGRCRMAYMFFDS